MEKQINYKKEKFVVLIMAVFFAVWNRIAQMKEISRIFYIVDREVPFYVLLVISFFLSVGLFFLLLYTLFEIGRWKRPEIKPFFVFFSIYYIFQLLILVAEWPGNFKADEIYVLAYAVSDLQIYWGQSFITQIFYDLSLMIFPYVVSIVFFQVTIISILAAGVMVRARALIKNHKLIYFLFLPFILFPVIDSNMFPLRCSLIAWIFLYCMVDFYVCGKNKAFSFTHSVITVGLYALVCVWKMEYICTLPFFFIMFLISQDNKWKKAITFIGSFGVYFFVFSLPQIFFKPDDNYLLTTIMTPLSEIVSEHMDDYDESLEKEWQLLDDCFSLERLQETTTGMDTPVVLYEVGYIGEKEETELVKAGLKICMHYWKDFLRNRINVYTYTNGFVENAVNYGCAYLNVVVNGTDLYHGHFRFTDIGNERLRDKVIAFFACRSQNDFVSTNFMFPLFYNCTFATFILLMVMVIHIINKKIMEVLADISLLLLEFVVFLLAPAVFFMYYIPFYLTSVVYLFILLLHKIDQKC